MGSPAPDFRLPAAQGGEVSLDSAAEGKKGVLVIFTCNHCPYAKASWPLVIGLVGEFGEGVGFVAINPNDADTYPEDSFEAMQKEVLERGIGFPYLYDESQEVAREYKAQCTPDVYVFKNDDGKLGLFYHGRINDNWQHPEEVKEENARDALRALVSGGEPPSDQRPSMGCSIKWKE